ncbi:MAG: hypothetical protein DRN99_07825 [Thermoproteota archaeon]|nr:MAG: hypothetical protein DRN99_07825 [Candidatus Korarchaeota archaeon]
MYSKCLYTELRYITYGGKVKVKTSIYVRSDVWRKLKEYARREGKDVSEVLEDLAQDLPSEVLDDIREFAGETCYELDFEPVSTDGEVSALVREMRDERGCSLSG